MRLSSVKTTFAVCMANYCTVDLQFTGTVCAPNSRRDAMTPENV